MASEHAQFKTIYMQRTILRDKLLQRYPAVYGTTKQSVNTKIAQAIHEGVLLEKTKKGSLRVYMNENYGLGLYQADSRTVLDDGSTLYVTGTRVRFAPLIRYMLGPPALRPKIAKIQGYFNSLPRNPYGRKLKEITALVGEAVQQGLLQYTNEARSSVQLVPGRSYQFS
ncbi:hypothetical protein BDW22DRAFT_980359 [Trametopsis cervina]|nr:hypothetical protein BDW22DRAFT_980359 [Trametopsis cervina]